MKLETFFATISNVLNTPNRIRKRHGCAKSSSCLMINEDDDANKKVLGSTDLMTTGNGGSGRVGRVTTTSKNSFLCLPSSSINNRHASHLEPDEGYCIHLSPSPTAQEPKSTNNSNNYNINEFGMLIESSTTTECTMRRVRSTPNLLEIPNPGQRSRKRSDDSAVGSGEESESSDKLSDDISTPDDGKVEASSPASPEAITTDLPCGSMPPSHTTNFTQRGDLINRSLKAMTVDEILVPSLACLGGSEGQVFRPPSVVVSDHDLCSPAGEISFMTLDDIEAEYLQSNRMDRRLSDCSTCSSFSFSDTDYTLTAIQPVVDEAEDDGIKKVSRWKTVRHIFHQLTPFILTYKNSRYPWVQLSGHQGNFKPGEQQGTILKKFCDREKEAFELLMEDSLRPFVPQYYGTVQDDTEHVEYIQLQDLLGQFDNPCVMDCKLGVRTYLEDELLKAKEKPKLRKDMYEKMCQIDSTAPTPEEHQLRGVTKPRYMVWRETISTTSTFGFRIEGVRKSDGFSSKDFKTTRTEDQVREAFTKFVSGFPLAASQYLKRLHELREALAKSVFFETREVVGSSLLFVHDSSNASIWMIDFAKTCPVPDNPSPITHDKPWSVGNHEDGYLIGLTYLINFFTDISQGLSKE